MNEAGEEVLKWLEGRKDADVVSVVEKEEQLDVIRDKEPEMVICSGFKSIVPPEILQIPDKGIVNLHPSYLPFNRGSHPYIWPLVNETPAGVSVHFMDSGLDTGPLVARRKVEKKPEDTAFTLRERLMDEQASLFKDNWDKVLAEDSRPQDLEKGETHRPEDLDELSILDLDREMELAGAIDLLRALTYGENRIARFEKEDDIFSVGIEIERSK